MKQEKKFRIEMPNVGEPLTQSEMKQILGGVQTSYTCQCSIHLGLSVPHQVTDVLSFYLDLGLTGSDSECDKKCKKKCKTFETSTPSCLHYEYSFSSHGGSV